MSRQLSSRAQRSKGFKVKHVLQIFLLLAICLWLIYQIKHSHNKKKQIIDVQVFAKTLGGGDTLKLGRKDLNPRVVQIVVKKDKPGEEDEEAEVEGENNRHEDEEPHEEIENEEKDNEVRGAGDGEKADTGTFQEEDNADDERERVEEGDEKYDDEKEDQTEDENSTEDQTENTREAREEHYKGDDASSAVTHDAQSLAAETDDIILKDSGDNPKLDFHTKIVDEYGIERKVIESHSKLKFGDAEMVGNSTSLYGAADEREANESALVKHEDELLQNVTELTQTRDQPESVNNLTDAATRTPNASDLTQTQNVTVADTVAGEGSVLKMIVQEQSSNASSTSVDHQSDSNPPVSTIFENITESVIPKDTVTSGAETGDDSSGSSKPEEITQTENLGVEENQKDERTGSITEARDGSTKSLTTLDDTDASHNEKLDITNDTDEPDKDDLGVSSAGRNEEEEQVLHDPIDFSDSSISQEDEDVHVDLDALPDIGNELNDSEDAAAE